MIINFIEVNDTPILFYGESTKDLMAYELNDLDIKGTLNIFDSLPLITKEDILKIDEISNTKNVNIKLFYKDTKVGEYINGFEEFVDFESDNFFVLDNAYNYEEIFKIYNQRIIEKHRRNGVFFINSNDVYIAPKVTIGKGTYIYNGVTLLKETKIGENNVIGPYSTLENFVCGCYNEIKWFVGKSSSIGDNNILGPFSHFRDDVTIEDENVIGNYNELKSSTMGSKNRMKHLSYLGNAKVGNHVNFGCGVITANYDGKSKHITEIEDDVFIGCNSVLVAPVKVDKNSFIAAHSIINENLEEYDFAIGRSKQITKKQYMKK